MNFTLAEIAHIFRRGLGKARTLQSCHFVGASNFDHSEISELFKILKIRKEKNIFPAKLDILELRNLFAKLPKITNLNQFFADGLRK